MSQTETLSNKLNMCYDMKKTGSSLTPFLDLNSDKAYATTGQQTSRVFTVTTRALNPVTTSAEIKLFYFFF